MTEGKSCTVCGEYKELSFFYLCGETYRSDCKVCTIRRNTEYSKRTVKQKSPESQKAKRAYYRLYYAKNKMKFYAYRKKFLEKNPGYNQQYYQRNKWLNEKTGGRSTGHDATD